MHQAGEFAAYERSVRTARPALVAGLLAPVAFATQASTFAQFASILGVAAVLIGSAFGLGGAIGFLFGIPRSLQDPMSVLPSTTWTADTPGRAAADRYAGNTSLEQISDWLTKILVGVGLTQLTNVPAALSAFATYLAPALGGFPSSGTFGILLATYYTIGGMFIVYMWTRLFMKLLLTESDSAASRSERQGELWERIRQTDQRVFTSALGSALSSMAANVLSRFGDKASAADVANMESEAIATANKKLESQQVIIDISAVKPTATEPIRVPVDDTTTVAELLNVVYSSIAGVVPLYTYGTTWILEDPATGKKLDKIGTTFAQSKLKKEFDDRFVSEVGIKPGMNLRAILLSK